MTTKKLVQAVDHKAKGYIQGKDRPAGERWVTMSNALVRAGHGLTLSEKRLVMTAVSKLDSRQPLRPGEVRKTKVTALEYAETYGIDSTTAYEALKSAAKSLYNRSITMFEPASQRDGKPLKPVRTDMRWVGRCQYHEGEGWVELGWWPELMPALTDLKKQFTTYQLQQASALRSAYSWRLLELLMHFEASGWAEYTVEDFAASMDATEKQRADFAKLRTKIIEPAVNELSMKDGWIIEWIPIKAGRRVAKVRFTFRRNPQGCLAL